MRLPRSGDAEGAILPPKTFRRIRRLIRASAYIDAVNISWLASAKGGPNVSRLSLPPAPADRHARLDPDRPGHFGRDRSGAGPAFRTGAPEPDSGGHVPCGRPRQPVSELHRRGQRGPP